MDWLEGLGALLTGVTVGSAQKALKGSGAKEVPVVENGEGEIPDCVPVASPLFVKPAPQTQSYPPVLDKAFADDVKNQLKTIKDQLQAKKQKKIEDEIAKLKQQSDQNWAKLPQMIRDCIAKGGEDLHIGNYYPYASNKPSQSRQPFIVLELSKVKELESLRLGRVYSWNEDRLFKKFAYVTINFS